MSDETKSESDVKRKYAEMKAYRKEVFEAMDETRECFEDMIEECDDFGYFLIQEGLDTGSEVADLKDYLKILKQGKEALEKITSRGYFQTGLKGEVS